MLSFLLAACTVGGLNLQSASAYTSPSTAGYYGAVTPRGVLAGGVYYRETGALYGSTVPALTVTGPVVGRSAATTGAQTVEYRYAIYQWSGSGWVNAYNSMTFVQAIPAGYSAAAFEPSVVRTAPVATAYRVTFSVTWKDAYGRFLGARNFDYAHAGDYRCTVASCTVGSGWVRI